MPWHNKRTGAYSRNSTEAYDNAVMAYGVLAARGWSLTAFCAMWGNVEHESEYNPWRWQSDSVLPVGSPYIDTQSGHAYGLVQWDSASKYINGGRSYSGYGPNYSNQQGSDNDGTAQMNFLDDTAVSSGQYFPNPNYNYQVSYANFKQASLEQHDMYWWVRAWFHNYERGTWSDRRVTAANYWYSVLGGVEPPPQPPTPPEPSGKIPIWLLFRLKERNSLK